MIGNQSKNLSKVVIDNLVILDYIALILYLRMSIHKYFQIC